MPRTLTEIDIDVLQRLADGAHLQEIAQARMTTEQVIKNRLGRIRKFLGADSSAQAVAMALRRRLID